MSEQIAVKPNYGGAADWASSITEKGEVKAGSIWVEGSTANDSYANLALDLDEAEELINGLAAAIAEIRKAEREALPTIPTEPGLYVAGNRASAIGPLYVRRVFRLDNWDGWQELTLEQEKFTVAEMQQSAQYFGGLTPLTYADGGE